VASADTACRNGIPRSTAIPDNASAAIRAAGTSSAASTISAYAASTLARPSRSCAWSNPVRIAAAAASTRPWASRSSESPRLRRMTALAGLTVGLLGLGEPPSR
jgi:hypothetical protein